MITLTTVAGKRLGSRASAYASEHATVWGRNRCALLPCRDDVPDGVARTLDRVYGQPHTIDRGETAYWEIPLSDCEPEQVEAQS